MIYKTSRCPICHGYIKFLNPDNDAYGSPFVICPSCNNIVIDRDKQELALKNKASFYRALIWRMLISVITTTFVAGLLAGIVLSLIKSEEIIYTWQTITIGFIVALIFAVVRLNGIKTLWIESPEIKRSIVRLKSDTYRYALIKNNFLVSYDSIFDVLSYDLIQNRAVRDEIIMALGQHGLFNRNRCTYISNDAGVFDSLWKKYVTNKTLLEIRNVSAQQYLSILTAHAFGCGIIVGDEMICQGSNESLVYMEKCTQKIKGCLSGQDPYETALNVVNKRFTTDKSHDFEEIIRIALTVMMDDNRVNIKDDGVIKDCMRIMYDIGYSYIIQRNN